MKLEDQVVSLEIAKRLKEIDVKQESLFYHCINAKTFGHEQIASHLIGMAKHGEEYYSAFTVAELGEMLSMLDRRRDTSDYYSFKNDNYWSVYSDDGYDGTSDTGIEEKTEADARGKMLIYLIENNLVKVDDL